VDRFLCPDSGGDALAESDGVRAMRVMIGFADALAAIESAWSLLEAGFEVSAFAREGTRPPLRRSSSVELYSITPPEVDSAAALADLSALIERAGVDGVMPLDDAAVWLCRDACEGTAVELIGPSGHQAEVALDKRLQLAAATAAGFAVPQTSFLDSRRDRGKLEFPLVVRPATAVRERAERLAPSAGATTCADEAELERALAGGGEDGVLMAQPQLHGVSEGIFGLATPRGVRAWSAHRRVRMMNPVGSGSSACESIPLDEHLRESAERLVREVSWSGLFMIELLRDESGTPWFIELNGRAWGSMALARAANLEYPAWAAELALGRSRDLPVSAPAGGRRARHLGREIVHVLTVIRGPRSAAATWPSRLRTVRDVLSWRSGDRPYNWRRRPSELPLLIDDTVSTVTKAVSRKGAGSA
jgi:predicted ATP-grasp superfamily ATP-dependent carboligase